MERAGLYTKLRVYVEEVYEARPLVSSHSQLLLAAVLPLYRTNSDFSSLILVFSYHSCKRCPDPTSRLVR